MRIFCVFQISKYCGCVTKLPTFEHEVRAFESMTLKWLSLINVNIRASRECVPASQ